MVAITGATGMLGAYILFYLLKAGYTVKALKRESSSLGITQTVFRFLGAPQNMLTKVTWVNGDLTCPEDLMDFISPGDTVYHAAAVVSFDTSERETLFKTNLTGTQYVVDTCIEKKAAKLCYISSIAALGTPENPNEPVNETHKKTAGTKSSGYSESKFRAELEVWRGNAEGLKTVIVNPSVIMGVGDWKNGSSALVGAAAKGLHFFTEGITGYTDARDVAQIAIKLTESEITGERYIINTDNLSFKQLFNMLTDAMGVKRPSIKAGKTLLAIAQRTDYVRTLVTRKKPLLTKETVRSAVKKQYYSNQKVLNALSWDFIEMDTSVKEIAQFYLNNNGKQH